MTVRTWFTISAVAALALVATFALRAFRPIPPPELLARVDDTRIEGVYDGSCWPQSEGDLRCEDRDADVSGASGPRVPAEGMMRFIAAYPVQPAGGTLEIVDAESGATIVRDGYAESVPYELEPGRYAVMVEARYPDDAYVRYVFAFEAA